MVDIFFKWVELVPMRSKESSEVIKAIQLYIIVWFYCSYAIYSDRGTGFVGALTKLFEELSIQYVTIST